MKTKTLAAFYLAFSRVYLFPDKEMAAALEKLPWDVAVRCGIITGEEVEALQSTIHSLGNETSLASLAREYTRLFINAPDDRALPPYESVYKESYAQLLGTPAKNMKAFLDRYEIDIAEDPQLMPDHLSVELELLAYLLASEDREDVKCTRVQSDIRSIVSNILKWFEPFNRKVASIDPPALYRACGTILIRLLEYHTSLH